jgi:hypothetical protein
MFTSLSGLPASYLQQLDNENFNPLAGLYQYNTVPIQYKTIQHNTLQYNTLQ